jgi:ATP-dependent DNA ligase
MVPHLLPMLAVPGRPFESADYVFEVKWDGIRALAALEARGWQLWGRQGADYTARYPELDVLRRLPAGTLVDGELVAFRGGRPDLATLMRRHPLVDPVHIRHAPSWCPVRYVLFDLLYLAGQSLLHEPLEQRRARLAEVCGPLGCAGVLFSAGVVGRGLELYAQALASGHEGVMAKRRTARYRPGRRSAAWLKIKPGAIPLKGKVCRAGMEST